MGCAIFYINRVPISFMSTKSIYQKLRTHYRNKLQVHSYRTLYKTLSHFQQKSNHSPSSASQDETLQTNLHQLLKMHISSILLLALFVSLSTAQGYQYNYACSGCGCQSTTEAIFRNGDSNIGKCLALGGDFQSVGLSGGSSFHCTMWTNTDCTGNPQNVGIYSGQVSSPASQAFRSLLCCYPCNVLETMLTLTFCADFWVHQYPVFKLPICTVLDTVETLGAVG